MGGETQLSVTDGVLLSYLVSSESFIYIPFP
jgi:hypothetical protein